MWNNLNLKCPTQDFCQYNKLEGAILEEFSTLIKLLNESAKVLSHHHPIWNEIKVFRNIKEKYRRILHSDKCLLLLQRVGTCLRKMTVINISKTYLNLAKQFDIGLQRQDSSILLPSRQQLEYVLLRTQSAAKMICETLKFSREAFCYIIQRLRMGQLILNFVMAASVISRLNILLRDILVQIFNNYKKLYIWPMKLKKGIAEWPKPLDLPPDLESWLNPEASDLLKPQEDSESHVAFLSNFFEKQTNGDKPVVVDNKNDNEYVNVGDTSGLQCENLDVGEAIPRPRKNKQIKRQLSEEQTLLLQKIQNAKSLKKLTTIWSLLDVDSQVPLKTGLIEKEFIMSKKKLKKIKQLDVPDDVKEKQKVVLVRLTGIRLAKHLGLMDIESEASTSETNISVNPSVEELKPAKTFKQLKQLYCALYQKLQYMQEYQRCTKLKQIFKNRISDIKHLITNDERKAAKRLIFSTSKELLTFIK